MEGERCITNCVNNLFRTRPNELKTIIKQIFMETKMGGKANIRVYFIEYRNK